MVESMTGFGSSEKEGFKVEIRSLNHRFLEMFIRMPSGFSSHEMAIRDRLRKSLTRGKLDVFVTVSGAGKPELRLNEDAAKAIYDSLEGLAKGLPVKGEVTLDTLLQWKSLFVEEKVTYEEGPLYDAFDEAVAGLKQMRLREGGELKTEVLDIADRIEKLNSGIESLCAKAAETAREKFRRTIRDLVGEGALDESRIAQEASAIADKIDITEEVTRVKSHLSQMRSILDDGGTVGRKLDFLMQELIREANTMGSKSGDAEILSRVIDMKSEIERAREQVQNIQ